MKQQQFMATCLLLLLALVATIVNSLECEIENYDEEICAFDRLKVDKQIANCLLLGLNVQAKLYCEIDRGHSLCGMNGCILAHFELNPYNKSKENQLYATRRRRSFEHIKDVQYRWRIQEYNKTTAEGGPEHRRSSSRIRNSLEYETYYVRNVSLDNDGGEELTKNAMLRIANVTHDIQYDICVSLISTIGEASQVVESKLCCHIVIEEPEEEVISFNMELMMIGFLILFYFIIALIAWKCPQRPDIREIFRSMPADKAEQLAQLSLRRPDEVRRRRGASNVSEDYSYADSTTLVQAPGVLEETATMQQQNTEEVVIEPLKLDKIQIIVQDDSIQPVAEDTTTKPPGVIVSTIGAANLEAPSRASRSTQRRFTEFAIPTVTTTSNESKTAAAAAKPSALKKKKEDLRRKSVQFFSSVLENQIKSATSGNTVNIPTIKIDKGATDSDSEELTTREKQIKFKDLNRRRQSMLIGPGFFSDTADTTATTEKKKSSKKNENSVKFEGSDDEAAMMDAYEEAAAKVYTERTRRASIYPFHKAFTLNVSDSD